MIWQNRAQNGRIVWIMRATKHHCAIHMKIEICQLEPEIISDFTRIKIQLFTPFHKFRQRNGVHTVVIINTRYQFVILGLA
ncbi:hypothetical protein D3C76_1383560 [compost metagenome]